MLRISKDKYDKSYPYKVYDSWGGVCYCSIEDLQSFRKELDKFFELEQKMKENP